MENVLCPFFCSNPLYYLYKEQGFARLPPFFFFAYLCCSPTVIV